MWALAGTIGVAVGPALGGFLTQLFSWRSIFLLQAPLAAIALVAVFDRRVRAVELTPRPERRLRTGLANAGFLALYGALVGALFLSVLLLVVVWGWSPIAGALVVTALPVATIFVRWLIPGLPTRVAVGAGGVALAGGLIALGLLPASTAGWAAAALAACGLGLGLLGGVLAPAAVPPDAPGVRPATISIAARHAGFVLALAVIAPVLSASLNDGARVATRATTAEVLDSSVSLRTKVSLAFDLRDLVADAPRGAVPDPTVPFDKRGAGKDAKLRATRDAVVSAIRDTLTRGFRSSFFIAAAFAVAAALAAAFLRNTRVVPGDGRALVLAGVIVGLVVALDRIGVRRGRAHVRGAQVRGSVPRAGRSVPAGPRHRRHAAAHLALGDRRRRVRAGHGPRGADPVARAEKRLRARCHLDPRHARRRVARRPGARDR